MPHGYSLTSQTGLAGEAEAFRFYWGTIATEPSLSAPNADFASLRFLSVAWTMTDYDGTTQ